jgi:hypothetical protein
MFEFEEHSIPADSEAISVFQPVSTKSTELSETSNGADEEALTWTLDRKMVTRDPRIVIGSS